MKHFSLAIFFAISSLAFGAELQLNGGESATIQANVTTQVTCGGGSSGGGGNSCETAAKGFEKLLEYCSKSYSSGDCVTTHWPRYKANNPNCIYAGLDACLTYCSRSFSSGDCANSICR